MNKRRLAKRYLIHYMKLAASGGYSWDYDNASEIESIVDHIIDAAVEEAVKQIKAELAPKDNQPHVEDEDGTLYYRDLSEGIKRFER